MKRNIRLLRRHQIPQNCANAEKVVSPEHEYIWLFMPKVAGSSVKKVLTRHASGNPHSESFEKLFQRYPKAEQYFLFSFVRNPWDRVVSCYRNKICTDRGVRIEKNIDPYAGLRPYMPFPEFVEFLLSEEGSDLYPRANRHWVSQYIFVTGPDNHIFVDYIGYYERLQEQFDEVMSHLGLESMRLPILNTSDGDAKDSTYYRDYYTPKLRKRICNRYAKDIELFGYRF